jgi:predicted DNA-binding transcriptional regulator AlpA
MQVLSYDEAAARAGIVRRTLERLISLGEGPAIVEISSRRRGIMESDLERWLNARRRLPPGMRESESHQPSRLETSAA